MKRLNLFSLMLLVSLGAMPAVQSFSFFGKTDEQKVQEYHDARISKISTSDALAKAFSCMPERFQERNKNQYEKALNTKKLNESLVKDSSKLSTVWNGIKSPFSWGIGKAEAASNMVVIQPAKYARDCMISPWATTKSAYGKTVGATKTLGKKAWAHKCKTALVGLAIGGTGGYFVDQKYNDGKLTAAYLAPVAKWLASQYSNGWSRVTSFAKGWTQRVDNNQDGSLSGQDVAAPSDVSVQPVDSVVDAESVSNISDVAPQAVTETLVDVTPEPKASVDFTSQIPYSFHE